MTPPTLKSQHVTRPFYLLLVVVFFLAPLYSYKNIPGYGFNLPYNISIWCTATWLICYAIYLVASNAKIYLPDKAYYLLFFPVMTVAYSLSAYEKDYTLWLFEPLYIIGGILFLFALFQFNAKQKSIDNFLYYLVMLMALHSLIGILQIFDIKPFLLSWLQSLRSDKPFGIFLQINVQASFLATGLSIIIYLISRPNFNNASFLKKAIFIISFSLSSYIIIYSGSRVGLYSSIFSLGILFVCRKKQLLRHKVMLLLIVIVTINSFLLAQAGFDRAIQKTEQSLSASSPRLNMYAISIDLIKEKPFMGHGIGTFLTVWNKQSALYYQQYPNYVVPNYVTHPHNEFLYWMIQGGLLYTSGLLVFLFAIALAIIKCGFQRGGAYAAMLFPISLHTQVEHPFYISSLHWFLWLFLVFIVLRHHSKIIKFESTPVAKFLLKTIAVLAAIELSYLFFHTAIAQQEITDFVSKKTLTPPYLSTARKNFFFQDLAETHLMRVVLFDSIFKKDPEKVRQYVFWVEKKIQEQPKPIYFNGLFVADNFLMPEDKSCQWVKKAISMYPRNILWQKINANCHD